jgi:hypothetical protein
MVSIKIPLIIGGGSGYEVCQVIPYFVISTR